MRQISSEVCLALAIALASSTSILAGSVRNGGTAQAGLTALVLDPRDPEHVYLGNGSVLQVDIEP